MRFTDPKMVKAIIAGRKTQMRFKVEEDEPTCSYEVGRSYAVQLWEPVKDEFGGRQPKWNTKVRVRVSGIRQQDIHDVSEAELESEGYTRRGELFRALGYLEHVRDVPLWVVTFAVDQEHHPRLLHRDSSHGYTENRYQALQDEPEAVDRDTLKVYALENRQGDELRHARRRQAWEAQQLSLRLAALESDPAGIDRDLAGIRERIETAEAKKRRRAA